MSFGVNGVGMIKEKYKLLFLSLQFGGIRTIAHTHPLWGINFSDIS